MTTRQKIAAALFGIAGAVTAAIGALDRGDAVDCSPKAIEERAANVAATQLGCADQDCIDSAEELYQETVKACLQQKSASQ